MISLKKYTFYALACVCMFVGLESYLRYKGYVPEMSLAEHLSSNPNFDPDLGWSDANVCSLHNFSNEYWHKVGLCKMLSYENPADHKIYATRCPDGSRKSRPAVRKQPSYRVLLLGCSYTYGVGVEDYETYAWLLNERFPDMSFDNFALPGYSTYQALLREEKILAKKKYDLVIYAGIEHHLVRNVVYALYQLEKSDIILPPLSMIPIPNPKNPTAPPQYQSILKANEPIWYYPTVQLNGDGTLKRIPAYRCWPGDNYLAMINTLKRLYIFYDTRAKYYGGQTSRPFSPCQTIGETHRTIYRKILEEMDKCAKEHGAKFAVVILENSGSKNTTLDSPTFPYAFATDGHEGEPDAPKFHAAGNMKYHGSFLVHQNWAKHISECLQQWKRDKKI